MEQSGVTLCGRSTKFDSLMQMQAPPNDQWKLLETVATVAHVLLGVGLTSHVLFHKRDTRSAIGWIGLIWLSPFVGSILYVLLGINRIQRKAQMLRVDRPVHPNSTSPSTSLSALAMVLGADGSHILPIARLVGRASQAPLLDGNTIRPLRSGREAYPAMLGAIESARHSISLGSYIFNDDRVGDRFASALDRANQRGVAIRVLVDAVGARQGGRPIDRRLRRMGLRAERFLPTFTRRWWRYANLRNHSKLLVVDGSIGFTGGMNILEDYDDSLAPAPARPKTDLHFEFRGPIVAALRDQFADYWAFSTGELLVGDEWFPALTPVGTTIARGIADGPDEDVDPLLCTLLGAIASARRSIRIVTPYFLPDTPLQTALMIAAFRGIDVEIVIPKENNQILVQWASMPTLERLLSEGCKAWLADPPFDHTKLFVIDDLWCLVGSANWDARSLVLNFEFCVECYDPAFVSEVVRLIDARRERATPLTLESARSRPLWVKFRDELARLGSPYL
jgi:cardiolipin synthase